MSNAPLPPPAVLRTWHGRSTRAWVGQGRLDVADDYWLALSGATHADFNLALCHGPGGASYVEHCADALTTARRPGLLALAGEARDTPDALRERSWRPVGSAPFMVTRLEQRPVGTARLLGDEELIQARDLVGTVFALPAPIADTALPVDPQSVPGRTVWGTFEDGRLTACAIAMQVDACVVIWSMATDPQARRRGHAADVLGAALSAGRAAGAEVAVLNSSTMGQPFYAAMGFAVVEHWEFWSHPRWVLAAD